MKCLTVLQPYPALMFLPREDRRWKGVENRSWRTSYRGPLLIHAGISKRLLRMVNRREEVVGVVAYDEEYGLRCRDLNFGAIIGKVDLVDCLSVNCGPDGSMFNDPTAFTRFPWLRGHPHIEGEICWILENAMRLKIPIVYKGAQGMFNVPDSYLAKAEYI